MNGKFIHRNGFGTICESSTATIGPERYTAAEIAQGEELRKPDQYKKPWLLAKKEK